MASRYKVALGILILIILSLGVGVSQNDQDLNVCGAILPLNKLILSIDVHTYFQAGCDTRDHKSPYPVGKWELARPENPNLTFRFDPFWAWVSAQIPISAWPASKFLITLLIGSAGIFAYYVYRQVFLENYPSINWSNYLFLGLYATILWAQIGFANLDPIMLALSGLLIWALNKKRVGLSALAVWLIFSLKLYLWLWPLFIPVVIGEWRLLKNAVLLSLIPFVLSKIILVIVLGGQYAAELNLDYVRFLIQGGQNIYIQGPQAAMNVFNNSLEQTFVRYFGFQPWIGPIVVLIILCLVAYFIWLVYQVWKARRNRLKGPTLWMVAVLVGLQAHTVFMLSSPQVETAMIVMIAVPLLWALNKSGKWLFIAQMPYFLFMIPDVFYMVTGIEFLNWPFSFPLVLLTFVSLMIFVHRNIFALIDQSVMQEPSPIAFSTAVR